jgi:hypothetical protein
MDDKEMARALDLAVQGVHRTLYLYTCLRPVNSCNAARVVDTAMVEFIGHWGIV